MFLCIVSRAGNDGYLPLLYAGEAGWQLLKPSVEVVAIASRSFARSRCGRSAHQPQVMWGQRCPLVAPVSDHRHIRHGLTRELSTVTRTVSVFLIWPSN